MSSLDRLADNSLNALLELTCSQNLVSFVLHRFLFILLGPLGKGPQYHEIGRSIATLMTDEVRTKYRIIKVRILAVVIMQAGVEEVFRSCT